MSFTRKTIDLSAEQDLVTGLITSTSFCAAVHDKLDTSLLQNDALAYIASWCLLYYSEYEQAPNQTIQAIYDRERSNLPQGLDVLVAEVLDRLSKRYTTAEAFNLIYMVDKAKDYLAERAIRRNIDKALIELDKHNTKSALQALSGVSTLTTPPSLPFKPLEKGFATKIANQTVNDNLFQLPGAPGRLFGPFKRKWFVCYMGSAKRGKTFQLLHTVHTALQANLKVFYASLEMDVEEDLGRFYQMLTKTTNQDNPIIDMPVFDCQHNQDGSCVNAQRTNQITLLYPDDNDKLRKPDYSSDLPYRVCTACRYTSDEYQEATWFESIEVQKYTAAQAERHNKKFILHHGNNFYMNQYPKFGATFSDILKDIDYLGVTQGWYPDVIVFDYADIILPEAFGDERTTVNNTWKFISRAAGERKALIITATQGNRGSFKQTTLDEEGISEDIRKLANVNMLISLNQTVAEKRMGVMRLGLMVHRHRDFDLYRQAKVLYNRQIGAVQLDSEIVNVTQS